MQKNIFVILIFLLNAIFSKAVAQKKFDDQIAGDSLYKAKDYPGAIARYSAAIETNKAKSQKLAFLYDKRAQVETDKKELSKAVEDETAAILLNPKVAGFYWNRAIAYGDMGQYQLAIDDYNKAIEFNKKNNEKLSLLYDNKGIEERHIKDFKVAIEDHTKAISYNEKNSDAYWNRGLARSLSGQYQLAIDDFTHAMYHNFDLEKLALLYGNRGNNKRLLKRHREALIDLNTAIELNSKNGRFYADRGLVYQSNGDYRLAINDFNTAIFYFKNSNVDLAVLYADLALNKKAIYNLNEAEVDATNALNLDKENGYFSYLRGDIYSQLGKSKTANEDYKKALNFYIDDKLAQSTLRMNIANNFYVLKEYQQVINECGVAIDLDPTSADPYFTRGKVYFKQMKNKELAIKDFLKATELDITKLTPAYIFSQLYLGHADVAIEQLSELILKTSSSDDVIHHYYNMARAYSIMNKPDEANIYLKKAIESGYSKEFAANDEDFDNIRKTPEYISLMNVSLSQK